MGYDNFFRLAAEPRHCYYRFAAELGIDTFANRLTCRQPRSPSRKASLAHPGKALTREYVREIQPGGSHLNHDFAFLRPRVRRLLYFEDFDPTVFVVTIWRICSPVSR